MMIFVWILLIILVLVLVIVILGYILLYKLKKFLGVSSISGLIKDAKKEDESMPKSLSSLDSLYLTRIKEDFPNLNINELKRACEKNIFDYFRAIESKDSTSFQSDKIKSSVDKKIQEYKDKNISFRSIQFHKTVVSKYEKNGSVATITFGSSLQYELYIDRAFQKKVQDRFRIQYIYIIDSSKLDKYSKVIGIRCPSCGSVAIDFKTHQCKYCGTYMKDIVKRVWYCNDLVSY